MFSCFLVTLIGHKPIKIKVMFTKTNLISTIVAAIWSLMGGYLLWEILAEKFMSNHMGPATGVLKENPDFGILWDALFKRLRSQKFSENGSRKLFLYGWSKVRGVGRNFSWPRQ
jgi:hypothetical protein